MRNFKIALPFLLFLLIGISCQKESTDVKTDPVVLEDWTFSTDEFVSWSDIYDDNVVDDRKHKSASQGIRSATEDEADIVNQIVSAKEMKKEIKTISKEIGKPDWSYLMAFKSGSIHHHFELFVPLMDKGDMAGILTFTLQNDRMVMRATKKSTMDHLVRKDVDRSLLLAQLHTVSASNIFERIQEQTHTPRYEDWYDEVFSEGFEAVSNAKDVNQTSTVWMTYTTGGITLNYTEFQYTQTVSCPAPHEVEDPFGSGSIGDSYWDVDITPPTLYTGLPSNLPITTYIDLSELSPELTAYVNEGELIFQNVYKLDVAESSQQEVLDQFELILRLRAKFLCLGASWAPINLDRYFSNLTSGDFSGELYGCQVNINVARYSGRTNIGTSYSNISNVDGKTIWTINYDETSLPGVAITSEESCENTFNDKIWDPSC